MASESSPKASGAKKPGSDEKADEGAKGLWQEFIGLARLWPYLRAERKLVFGAMVLIPLISGLQTVLPLVLKRAIDDGILGKNADALMTGAAIFATSG